MAKTNLTHTAEKLLIKQAIKKCTRFGLEIPCSHNGKSGKVDFANIYLDSDSLVPDIVCYEIKVSEADFNSENGHNLFGDFNYYVISKELYDILKSKEKYNKMFEDKWYTKTGIIVFTEKQLKVVLQAKKEDKYRRFTFEERMRFIDNVLIAWTTGSMWKYMRKHGIKLRNEGDISDESVDTEEEEIE